MAESAVTKTVRERGELEVLRAWTKESLGCRERRIGRWWEMTSLHKRRTRKPQHHVVLESFWKFGLVFLPSPFSGFRSGLEPEIRDRLWLRRDVIGLRSTGGDEAPRSCLLA